MGFLSKTWFMLFESTSRSFLHSWLITGFVPKLTRRVPRIEQDLFTLPGHLDSPPVLSGVRVTLSLVLCVYFVFRCSHFVFTFSFGHGVVCSSSIYGFWLPLWYLQTLLEDSKHYLQVYRLVFDRGDNSLNVHPTDWYFGTSFVVLRIVITP